MPIKLRHAAILTAALGTLMSAQAAMADVVRVNILTLANKADYEASSAVLAKVVTLLKGTAGCKAAYPITDEAKLQEGTVSVWDSEDKFKALADTAEWKALLASGPKPTAVDSRFFASK